MNIYTFLDGTQAQALGLCLGWDKMNDWIESDITENQKKMSAVKYFSLAVSMALFILYGIVMG